MTNTSEQDARLVEIGRLFDAYGADDSRWPALARAKLAQASRLAPAAVETLRAEARALERLLAAAPARVSSADGERRLADKIMAAAMAGEGVALARPTAEVVSWPKSRPALARPPARPERWRNVAALMAASLLAGIILGGNLRLDPLLQDVAESVGLPAVFGVTTAALIDETGDEDAL